MHGIQLSPAHDTTRVFFASQAADGTVSSFVDSSVQHRGMRPNLIAMKKENSQSQNLNQARRTLPGCSNW